MNLADIVGCWLLSGIVGYVLLLVSMSLNGVVSGPTHHPVRNVGVLLLFLLVGPFGALMALLSVLRRCANGS